MTTFSYNGSVIQSYTVQTTGVYIIIAAGAQGGSLPIENGGVVLGISGKGDQATAEIILSSGTILQQLLVGGRGGSEVGSVESGGGGGSFVVQQDGTQPVALVVGGGGGGATYDTNGCSGGLTGSSSLGGSGVLNGAGGGRGGF